MLDVKVGDEVVRQDYSRAPIAAIVTKVGRVNVWIAGCRHPFSRESGKIKDNYGNAQIQTRETYEVSMAATSARKELGAAGVTLAYGISPARVLTALAALREWMGSSSST